MIKAGVIGLGVGEKHAEVYNKHLECELVALCDVSGEKLASVGGKFPGKKTTGNADEILEDPEINIVSIASYDECHYKQIVKAIQNDKHLFVEKPLCLYDKEARHIRSLLREKPQLKISSNLILRKSPRFIQLRELIKKGEFGDLFCIEGDYNYGRLHKITEGWRGKQDFYSVIYGGGIHLVDLILWLTDQDIEEVASFGNAISSQGSGFPYNDVAVSIIKFKNGMVGKISANFGCVMPHFHGLTVYGTKATFVNGMEYGMFFNSRNPDHGFKKITTPYPGVHKGDFISGFIESITRKANEEITQDEIFNTMSVCFAMEKALNQSCSEKVSYI